MNYKSLVFVGLSLAAVVLSLPAAAESSMVIVNEQSSIVTDQNRIITDRNNVTQTNSIPTSDSGGLTLQNSVANISIEGCQNPDLADDNNDNSIN